MIDGTWLRLPFRGWYVNDGTMTNQELNGCPPHDPVENLPGEESAGIDRQLQKAVEALEKEVEKSKKDSIWKGSCQILATKLHKGAQRKKDNKNHLNKKFLGVQNPFFKKGFGRRRQN